MHFVTARKTKFAKVMFSQVSVCPQEGGCLPHCMLGYTPSGPEADAPLGPGPPPGPDPPQSRHPPPGADTPWDQTPPSRHPPGPDPPGTRQPPPPVHAGRYGQQAVGRHPTGMHTR